MSYSSSDSHFKEKFTIDNSIVVEPINTGKRLLEEGIKQDHCIFSVNKIRDDQCFAFHVPNNGKKSTPTINPKMNLMQHHGKHNSKAIEIKNLKTIFLQHIDGLNCKFITVL
jgi:hypothetical protein